MKCSVLVSRQTNPAVNLALEEWLFDRLLPSQSILLLYSNSRSVICGTFQNPWMECDIDWMNAMSWPVLRRISGGGTVWHDPGNLNISWMGPRQNFDRSQLLRQIQTVLGGIGIAAEVNDRGDVLHNGNKLSGNALCYRSDRVLHHATLLVNAELADLRRALHPEMGLWQITHSQGVRSQRSAVTSVIDIIPDMDPLELKTRIEQAFYAGDGPGMQEIAIPELDNHFRSLLEKNQSWNWIFGRTPVFSIQNTSKTSNFPLNEYEITHGMIRQGQAVRPFPGFAALDRE